jgi:transcription elongation GreA/GreB family factor
MARQTIASLTAELNEARAMIESLRALNEAQAQKIQSAHDWMASASAEIKALRNQSQQPARASQPARRDNSAILAAMQAAKEQAMRTGKTVRVQ